MDWQIIVVLVVAIPVILLPVLFVWYLNIGGVLSAIREMKARRVSLKKRVKAVAKTE